MIGSQRVKTTESSGFRGYDAGKGMKLSAIIIVQTPEPIGRYYASGIEKYYAALAYSNTAKRLAQRRLEGNYGN